MNSQGITHKEQFQESMIPHMDLLYNYAFYLTGNREDASDLLQETYLKAFRFFDKFQPGTNAKAWLYRIMRNAYINEFRRLKRIPDHVEYDENVFTYSAGEGAQKSLNDFVRKIDMEMFDDEITDALSSLPEKFKSVIVLRDVQDLPYEEIAEALEIPVGTVRSRLHRGRGILFTRLKEYARTRGYDVTEPLAPAEFAMAI